MKKLTFICLLVSVACYINAQQRVVKRPPFIVWNTTALEIEKITLGDEETVLDIKVFSNPKHWIKIVSETFLRDDKGDVYPIRSGQGITLDEEFYTPQAGEASIKLMFEPIPQTAAFVDFIEGNAPGAFCIWGIQLKGNALPPLALPEGAVIPQPDMNAPLPEPQFNYGKAVLKGRILDYRQGMGKATVFLANATKMLGATEQVTLNDKGEFRFETYLAAVTPGNLRVNNRGFNFLIAPGEETEIIINLREYSRRQSRFHRDSPSCGERFYYKGYLAGVQQELATHKIRTNIGDNYNKMLEEIGGMNTREVTDYMLANHQEISRKIAEAPVSRACKEVLQVSADVSTAELICSMKGLINQSNAIRFKVPRDEWIEYMRANFEELPAAHYKILKDKFPAVNQPQAMYAFQNVFSTMTFMHKRDSIAKGMGTDKGILFDNTACMEVCKSIQEFVPMTEQQKTVLASLSSPAYLEQAEAMNRALLETVQRNQRKLADLAQADLKEVSNEDLYAAIVSKHRGKVVLIDIWATWCSPCRVANKEMAPLKEEWKDKDIVYVYIAGENSPEELWKTMSADISGEHHRLSSQQYDYLMESFNTSGVPTYIVVDRNGSVSRVINGYPGLATMKKALLEAEK